MSQPLPNEVQTILERVGIELLAILASDDIGYVTIHCNVKSTSIEVKRELKPFERKQKPITPARKSWE